MENKKVSTTNRKRSHPPKASAEVNTAPKVEQVANEFCALSSCQSYSNHYFGLNIFDLYKPDDLLRLVQDPMENNDLLRKLSLVMYGSNGTYTNTVDYMTALPTLDKVVVPHGKNKDKKTHNKELMLSTLNTIKDKEFVRDALFKGMIEGMAFYYFETTVRPMSNKKHLSDFDVYSITEINELGINVSIISLPSDYTRIVGIKNSSYVLAFNLDYFSDASGESTEKKLRKYPREIREAYEKNKNRSASDDNGNWVILDNTKTIAHKIRSKKEEPYGRPIVLAAISDILYRDYFTDTKRNVLDEINNRIIYQTFPEGKDKGTSALTKVQQENQHNAVKGAVLNKNNRGGTSFFSVAAGTKINSIDTSNTDIFDEKYESDLDNKIALDLGFAGNALSGSGSGSYSTQQTNLELVTSQLMQWIHQIENELNKCINANIIKDKRNWVECKYLPITHINKSMMVNNVKELYLQGCGSLSLWSAACGVQPEVFYALLDEEIEAGIYEKYKPHQTSYTLSSKDVNSSDNKGGRPVTDNPTEKTIQSRSNNGNALPSPSDNK